MVTTSPWLGPLRSVHGRVGLALLVFGEALIAVRVRPFSDFYFPFVWVGFTLLLDAGAYAAGGRSLFVNYPRVFVGLFGLSSAFWWFFELLNLSVHNWQYIGGERYQGLSYVTLASIDFATVLAAVWCAAGIVYGLLAGPRGVQYVSGRAPRFPPKERAPRSPAATMPSKPLLLGMLALAPPAVLLPILFPRYTFGLIWLSMFFLLDPINAWCGRPAMITAAVRRDWRMPLSFALGTLICGFCWEAWNFWSLPKWIYDVPYVGFWHIFEMPFLGYSGYLPFGLELFAMTNFFLPLLGLGTLTIEDRNRSAALVGRETASWEHRQL